MKKKLSVFAVGLLVALVASTGTVLAVQFIPKTENIFTVNELDDCENGLGGSMSCNTVSTFKHNGNRCYVVSTGSGTGGNPAISCVRYEKQL